MKDRRRDPISSAVSAAKAVLPLLIALTLAPN
jgi:hypothetical protein